MIVGSNIKQVILNYYVKVSHTAHWGGTWKSVEEYSTTLRISWANWWPKLMDLIRGFIPLNP